MVRVAFVITVTRFYFQSYIGFSFDFVIVEYLVYPLISLFAIFFLWKFILFMFSPTGARS